MPITLSNLSRPAYQEKVYYPDILSVSECGDWTLHLPPTLQQHQRELEVLLRKVFNNRPRSPENIALAKQMSLNWCASKSRQLDINL